MMKKQIVMPAHLMDDNEHEARNKRNLFSVSTQHACRGMCVVCKALPHFSLVAQCLGSLSCAGLLSVHCSRRGACAGQC
jgi:hypothetical protein